MSKLKPGDLGVRIYPGPAMVKPCKNCPFLLRRQGKAYLHPQRYEDILFCVALGQPFWCHKTVNYDSSDGEASMWEPDYLMCAGAVEEALALKKEEP
jgi:hypothetical protein